tara:strand:- start:310 stop:615 length:306 start_codon:yes stop_codon:yes gene_type:complete
MYEQPRNIALMKGRRGIARKVKEDKVTIVANRLRNEIKVNNGRQLIKKWNDRNKFISRENPGNFNSKITPRENPNINIQNTRPSRSIVNSTKVSMRVKIKN